MRKARTVSRRETLEAALAKAEAQLQRAVTGLAAVGADRDAAGDVLNRARASCRDARAALTAFNNAEG